MSPQKRCQFGVRTYGAAPRRNTPGEVQSSLLYGNRSAAYSALNDCCNLVAGLTTGGDRRASKGTNNNKTVATEGNGRHDARHGGAGMPRTSTTRGTYHSGKYRAAPSQIGRTTVQHWCGTHAQPECGQRGVVGVPLGSSCKHLGTVFGLSLNGRPAVAQAAPPCRPHGLRLRYATPWLAFPYRCIVSDWQQEAPSGLPAASPAQGRGSGGQLSVLDVVVSVPVAACGVGALSCSPGIGRVST